MNQGRKLIKGSNWKFNAGPSDKERKVTDTISEHKELIIDKYIKNIEDIEHKKFPSEENKSNYFDSVSSQDVKIKAELSDKEEKFSDIVSEPEEQNNNKDIDHSLEKIIVNIQLQLSGFMWNSVPNSLITNRIFQCVNNASLYWRRNMIHIFKSNRTFKMAKSISPKKLSKCE